MRQEVARKLEQLSVMAGVRARGDDPAPTPSLALTRLALSFGLSPLEVDALCLAVGTAVVPELRKRLGAEPSVGDVLALLAPELDARLRVLGEGFPARLVEAGLIRPLRTSSPDAELVPTRRARAILLGGHPLDGLPRFARRVRAEAYPPLDVDPVRIAAALRHPSARMLVVTGDAGTGKTTLLRAVAAELADERLEVDVGLAASLTPPGELGVVLAELITDAALAHVPILLDPLGDRVLLRAGAAAAEMAAVLEHAAPRVLVAAGSLDEIPPILRGRATLTIEVVAPSPRSRAAIWRAALGTQAAAHHAAEIEDVSEAFSLTPRQIALAAAQASAEVPLREAAAAQLSGRSGLLDVTAARRGLDRLVLAPETRTEIEEIVAAVRGRQALLHDGGVRAHLSRGRGLSALFDGEPGTGKTAACEAIAVETGYPLLRVNLATVVDKYVGETEKNLARIFGQARARGAILLFDEADALLAARTSVTGANDRFANLEVNLLLQLLEEQTGIVFLTTNLKGNLDPALQRRVTFKVSFEVPDAALRAVIWRGALPQELLDEDIDPDSLARAYPLAGGGIQSAALRAAYLAAGAGRRVSQGDLLTCAERECGAMGKVVRTLRRIV